MLVTNTRLVFCVAAAAATICLLVHAQSDLVVEQACLNCLCEASSHCNTSIGCFEPYPESYFCGAFGISRDYWIDSGKPVIKNDNPDGTEAFENCVRDLYCAAQTVHGYMNKFSNEGDCNGDGKVDCLDFARMHTMGGYDCSNPNGTETHFYQDFEACWQQVNRPEDATELPA